MPDVASLSVVVSANTTDLERGLQQADQQVSSFGKSMASVFSGIGVGLGIKAFDVITDGFKAAGDAAIGFNSNMEQSTIAFTSMLGSAEKAQAFLDDMKQFAATTPFEFPDLLQASKQMMAFGFAAQDVRPLLTAVGSAAAAMGTGRSGVDSITKALGQMKAATVVQAGELNQLTEQGVPAFQILADAMGISTGEVKKLASEGKIASDVFITAFQNWAQNNYGDMMAKQALTFEGAISTIKDSLTFAAAEAFKPFFELMSAGAVQLASFVQSDTFASWAQATAATVRTAFQVIADSVRTIQQVMAGDWSPAENIQPVTLAVGELAVAFRDNLWPAIQVVVGFVTGTLVPALQAVGTFLAEHAELIAGLAAAWAAFAVISTVAGWIMGAIAAFGAFSTAITAAGGVIAAIIAVIGGPLTLVILAIAAVIGVLTAAWIGNWGDIQGKTATAIAAITAAIQTGLTAIQGFWTAHGQQIMTIVTAFWTIITTQFTLAWTVLSGIITVGMQLLSGDWQAAWTTITTVAQAIWDSWGTILTAVWTIITTLFGEQIAAVQSAWTAGWTAIETALQTAWTTIQGVVQAGWDAVTGIFTAAWNLLSAENQTRVTALITLITELWTTLGQLWTTGTTAVTTLVTTWWAGQVTFWTTQTTAFVTFLTRWWADIVALWTKAQDDVAALVEPWWTTIKGYWDVALKYITDALAKVWADIVTATTTFFTDLGTKFTEAQTTLGQAATDLGTAIMESLKTAINAKVQSIVDSVTGAVKSALDAARSLIGGASGSSGNAAWDQIAREEGVDPSLLASLIQQESGGNQSARSGAGAIGLTQLMPGTAASMGLDPNDPAQNVRGGARYLKQMLDQFGDEERALIAYNAGPGGGSPAESRAYAQRVLAGRVKLPAGVGAAQQNMTPQINQFGLQGGTLTAAEAAAFCGPAAAMWFANIYGRMPDKAEAEAMARSIGWTPEWGMTGPGSEQRLLSMMGVASNVDYSPTPAEIGALAAQNVPFQLSTAGHFYQVQGGSLGGLNVGGSGVAAGGSATMSLDQITALSGAINGIITLAPQMGAALTMASAEGGTALSGLLLSATTLSDGSTVAITQMGQQITASIVDASGQVVATYGQMAETVVTQTATMAAGSLTSITNLGTGIMTTITDSAGSTITTITDMSGQVTSQYATLANGVSLTMGDMAAGVLTSTTDLGTGVMTTVQDMSGNYITTITDLSGNVTSQYVSLGAAATAETATMAAAVTAETATMSADVLTSVTDMGDGTMTITQNAAGEMVATITDMSGNVTSQYSTMSSEASAETAQMASDVVADFQQLASDATAAAQELGSGYVGEMQSTGGDVQEEAEQWMQDILDTLESAISDAKDQASEIGSGITDGIAEGIKDGSDAVMDAVSDVIDDAIDEAKDEAESDSPSKLFARELGLPIAQGVAVGIEKGSGLVADATRGLVGVPEYAAPLPGGSGAGGSLDTIVLKIDIGGRVAEEIYVTGRELAIARGRGG